MLPTRPSRDAPAVIVYNSNNEAITITHRNIVAAASALALEYAVKCVSLFVSTAGIPT